MKALVSGAAGFVGRNLVPKLKEAGYFVVEVDPRIDGEKLEAYLLRRDDDDPFDVVVHLAANIESIDKRMEGGVAMYQDLALDYAMAEWLSRFPPTKAAVWMSSCAVLHPADEPYYHVKAMGERLASALWQDGVHVKVLRPYSGYGADQSEAYPFPAILSRALRREDPLTVWGDGLQVRDFVHIHDLVRAILHAIDHFPSGVPIPIGTGRGTDFLTLAKMIATEVGYSPTIERVFDKPMGSLRRVCDPTIARQFNWNVTINLEAGIKRAVLERTLATTSRA